MSKQLTTRIFLITAVNLVMSSSIWALDFLGPPIGQLNKGKWSAGVEYSTGEMELKAKGTSIYCDPWAGWSGGPAYLLHPHSIKIKQFRTQKTYGTIGYGLTDSSDLIVSLGTVKSDWSHLERDPETGFHVYNHRHLESHDLGI